MASSSPPRPALVVMFMVGILVFVLSGCGITARPGPRPSVGRALRIAAPPASLALVPLYVAQAVGALHRWHVHVVPPSQASALQLAVRAPAQSPPAVVAYLMVKPDTVLVSRVANPDFRWRSVAGSPIVAAGVSPASLEVATSVLREHHVATHVEPVSWATAQRWFRQGRLPYVLAPLLKGLVLVHQDRGAVLAFVGAGTGPVATAMLAAAIPPPAAWLAALNTGLDYVASHPPSEVARLIQRDYPHTAPALLSAAIGDLDGLGAWPLTCYPATAPYTARAALSAGTPWPPYSAAVDPNPARGALAIAPSPR